MDVQPVRDQFDRIVVEMLDLLLQRAVDRGGKFVHCLRQVFRTAQIGDRFPDDPLDQPINRCISGSMSATPSTLKIVWNTASFSA